MFSFQETRGRVEVAFTDRHGGVSSGPYASLNLAAPPGDEAERDAVDENTGLVARALARGGESSGGNPSAAPQADAEPVVVAMRQTHGADVHTVDLAWVGSGGPGRPTADGLVTDVPGVILMVRVADCVPVLLADVERNVVGAAHAGRQGLVGGVVPNAMARMRELGAERVAAWVGPHVCGRCYEVPAAMRDEVAAVVPESYSETSWGTPAVDVGAGVVAQLAAAGAAVVDASRCTFEEEDLFSYRRQGAASGRLGGLVWVRP